MFDKQSHKKAGNQESQQPEVQASIEAMPQAFYGGSDPVIYHSEGKLKHEPVSGPSKKERQLIAKKEEEKQTTRRGTMPAPASAKPSIAPRQQFQQPANPQEFRQPHESKSWLWLLIIGMLLLVGIAGGGWYWLQQGGTKEAEPKEAPFIEPPPLVEEPVEPRVVVPPPVVEPEPLLVFDQDTLLIPALLPINSADVDQDGLTDAEEEFFSSDPGNRDSDQDGYLDGLEVRNLYSPQGFAPIKIIDSGFVREYTNPRWNYRLYYPVAWELDAVDAQQRQVLISTITADYVDVQVFDKRPGETITTWFARVVRGMRFQELREEQTRFKQTVLVRPDFGVAFFDSPGRVYALVYRPGTGNAISYPHIAEMIIQSFRPTSDVVELPEQAVLPVAPIAEPAADGASAEDSFEAQQPSTEDAQGEALQEPSQAEGDQIEGPQAQEEPQANSVNSSQEELPF